jgi:hypothetical protein
MMRCGGPGLEPLDIAAVDVCRTARVPLVKVVSRNGVQGVASSNLAVPTNFPKDLPPHVKESIIFRRMPTD